MKKITWDTGPRTQTETQQSADERMLGNCWTAAFIWLTFSWVPNPLPSLFSPWIPNPLPTLLAPYKMLAWKEMQDSLLGYITHHPLRSPAIWIKLPQRSKPCLCLLVLVVPGSMNADFPDCKRICSDNLVQFSFLVSKGTKILIF